MRAGSLGICAHVVRSAVPCQVVSGAVQALPQGEAVGVGETLRDTRQGSRVHAAAFRGVCAFAVPVEGSQIF